MPSAPFLHEHLPAQRLGSSPKDLQGPHGCKPWCPSPEPALELLHQPSRGVPGTWGVPTWPPVFAPGPKLVWPQPQPGTGAEIRILPPRRDPQPLGWRPPGREEELLAGDKKWPLWPPGASHGPVPQGGTSRLDGGEALPLRRIRPRCLLLFLLLSHQRQIPLGLGAERP